MGMLELKNNGTEMQNPRDRSEKMVRQLEYETEVKTAKKNKKGKKKMEY